MNILNKLIGQTVLILKEMPDYIQFIFDNNIKLNIYNDYTCNCALKEISSKKVVSIKCTDTNISIYFEKGRFLSINLEDHSYNGPEAMTIIDEDQFIVWN